MIFIKKQTTPPQLFLDAIAGLKPVYQLIDGKYWIIVPAKNSTPKKIQAEHYSAHILQATLDLMKQNRHEDNSNPHDFEKSQKHNF